MSEPRSQDDINREEWSNADNWSGVWLYRVYFSKRDSRVFVPIWRNSRFSPTMINLGHRWDFFSPRWM